MRIILCCETFYPKVDGAVRMVSIMADHLKERGHEVLILAPNLTEPPAEPVTEYNGMPVITFNGPKWLWYPEFIYVFPNIKIHKAIKEFQPDIIHLFHPTSVGMWSLLLAKFMRIPTVATFHIDIARALSSLGVPSLLVRLFIPPLDFLTWLMFSLADARFATSHKIQDMLHQLGVSNVGIWRRGVNQDFFNPKHFSQEMRDKLTNGDSNSKILIYVGRLSGEKSVGDLRPILNHVPNISLVIVGDGTERERLEALFSGTKAIFTGHISGLELSQVYASADLFVFPSSMETFGLVVLEAMVAKLPVVATRVGGIPNVITEGVNGYTVEVGDTDAMVDAVKKTLDDEDHRQMMAQNAYDYASQLSWETVNDEMIENYKRVIQSKAKKVTQTSYTNKLN